MANQRGIVAGWDSANSRPKGVTSAADMRASLQMIATHPGIMTEPGAATITLPSNAMRINWTAFTAVIRSTLGGWYTPRIDAGGIALSIGHATYPRIDVVWVRQRDYQTNASWPDSEVEVGVAQGTASATPSTPAVPTGALPVFAVRVPAGATTGSAIGLANITTAARTAPAGGIITAASQAEMDTIAAAGSDGGIYVRRSDLDELFVRSSATWQPVDPQRILAAGQSGAFPGVPGNGWQQVVLPFPSIEGMILAGFGLSPQLTISGDMDCASRLLAISETVGYESISIRVRNVTSQAGSGTWRVHFAIIRRRD